MTRTKFSVCMTNAHTPTPTATSTVSSPVCLKCGTIKKSGKSSCCGHGGSWFRNCGGSGNANRQHMWIDGILACNTQPQSNTAIEQQLKVTRENGIGFSSNSIDTKNFKSVSTAPTTAHVPAHTSTSTPLIVQGYEKVSNFGVFLFVLLLLSFH